MPYTVFVYESITGGGLFRVPGQPVPTGSLRKLGGAMVCALASDFEQIADVHVTTLVDARLIDFAPSQHVRRVASRDEHDRELQRVAASADATIVIAPELDGELLRIHDMVTHAGGKIIGPRREVIRWASDKDLTEERLSTAGIPTPCRIDLALKTKQTTGVFVIKRVDGAGSESMHRCDSIAEAKAFIAKEDAALDFRVEPYYPGTAVSVALLLGPNSTLTMPTCLQHLSDDGLFQYHGGRVLAPGSADSLQSRSARLAQRVATLLTDCTGYIGIDMIIGDTEPDDCVVEINPRLSTSYVGLRAATDDNLAKWILDLAHQTAKSRRTPAFPHAPYDFQANHLVSNSTY